jgi:hypothetical protein
MLPHLQQEEQREAMDSGCNRLEMVARDLFQSVQLALAQ